MSGQWELVSKNKHKSNSQNSKKLTKSEKKKFSENAPKIEDILPLSQVKSLYNSLDSNNTENSTVQQTKIKGNKENTNKQQQQQQKKKNNTDKKKEVKEKPVLPKNLEQSLKKFNVKEFSDLLNMNQSLYQDTPLIWLKNLSEYMNANLNNNNPSTSYKLNEYPFSIIPSDIKEVLKRAFSSAGDAATQHFFEFCLSLLANDMNKGNSSVIGYKIILQMIALQKPSIATTNSEKIDTLLKSHQSRPPIAKTILWCLGQGSIRDISKGLEIWWKYVVPLITMKNYTSFAIEFLKDILSAKGNAKPLTPDELFKLLNYLFVHQTNNLPKTDLREISSLLKAKSIDIENDNKLSPYFQKLLPALNQNNISKEYKSDLETYLITCLSRDKQSYSTWTQIYTKNIKQSSLLLSLINTEWKKYSNKLQIKLLRKTISAFQVTNQELAKNKKEDQHLIACQKICQESMKKMNVTRSFPWKLGSFVLILGIICVLLYDIQLHGSFQASSTALFLKDIGALKLAEKAMVKIGQFNDMNQEWIFETLPHYIFKALDYLGPVAYHLFNACIFVGDFLIKSYILVRDYIIEKSPILIELINHYAPGLLDTIVEYFWITWKIFIDNLTLALSWLSTIIKDICDWSTKNIISPENLQEYSLIALNKTQLYAVWTYDWISQRVQALTKVKKV